MPRASDERRLRYVACALSMPRFAPATRYATPLDAFDAIKFIEIRMRATPRFAEAVFAAMPAMRACLLSLMRCFMRHEVSYAYAAALAPR